ncbi:MAG TPA: hypothetical protein PLM86_07170 [Bacteroidales bacterium]|nr:MAG: hypothetical protein BWX93_00707 [Bacteroidetes bacterium ADurb.Bin139]HOG25950.1 hypothetical protein [Bacteroidales bacterium]HOR11816.1 hypothetical protein [Bacteroidales bacterium]HOZ19477.1 hypothetical protein [Bacteroidales bacterium]HPK39181.1 hypothetical protein [Bacteroidales bacterium]
MKALFISFYQAFYDEVLEALNKNNARGFTFWEEVRGRGSRDGEPHLGSHAWPTLNSALITFVPDHMVDPLLQDLKKVDESAPKQGLRAFVLEAEERTV